MAVEVARRAVPGHVRPSFQELEKKCAAAETPNPCRRRSCRSVSMNTTRPIIIIIKKKVSHGGHHGGAWKVAYADFVTAMMALFIVLWLLNTSKPVKEAIAGYFKDPSGTGEKKGTTKTGSARPLPFQRQHGTTERRIAKVHVAN